MNNTTITGNLTADPDLRYTKSGTAVCNLRLANNRKNRQTGDYDNTTYIDATVWKSLAENVADSLRKGDRVFVSGVLEQDEWTTDQGGQRSKLKLTAFTAGPDLRFATASVQRSENGGGGTSRNDSVGGGDADVPF